MFYYKISKSVYFPKDVFESDFSVMDCAALYRREIRIELLEIIELRSDLTQKAEFKTFVNYPNLWVSLLSIPDYRNLSQKKRFLFLFACQQPIPL